MRRPHGTAKLDELDRRLMALLLEDSRRSNRSMALEVGVTDETITARIRRLLEHRVLAVTALIDWTAAGYSARAYLRVHTTARPTTDVLKPLLPLEGIHVMSDTIGCCDAVITVLGRDLHAVQELVVDHVRGLDGVTGVTVDVVTETCRHDLSGTTLPVTPWPPTALPEPVVAIDEVDVRLLEQLTQDGHESNRELARRIGVSDGTVRARIRRLEEAGLLRIAAVVDPVTPGDVGAAAWVFLNVDGDDDDVVAALREDARVGLLERTIGSADLAGLVTSHTADELAIYLSRDLRSIPGVRQVLVASPVEALRHDAHLVHLG